MSDTAGKILEGLEYTTRPSAGSNGAYVTVYAPDGSFLSRHTSIEEASESAVTHAVNNAPEGESTYRIVPPERHLSIRLRSPAGGNWVGGEGEVDVTPPGPPVGGFLNAFTASSATVNWTNDPANDIAFTRIYKSTTSSSAGFTLLTTVAFPAVSYVDTAYNPQVQSWYRLSHVDNVGNESEFGVVFTDNTAPSTPAPPTVQSVTTTTVTLAMPPVTAPDHASFLVNRSSDGNTYAVVGSGITSATWQDTSLNPASTYYYRARSEDRAGNRSPSSTPVTATTSSTTQLRNWNPGHYYRPGPWRSIAAYKTAIDFCNTNSGGRWKGIQIIAEWKNLEIASGAGTQAQRFAPGFDVIDDVLSYAISNNKQIQLNIWPNNFSGTTLTSPTYIQSAPYGADYVRGGGGTQIRQWNTATWDRFTEMVLAYFDRYKNETNFEFIKVPGETAYGSNAPSQSDFNRTAADDNLIELTDACLTATQGTKLWYANGFNSFAYPSLENSLYARVAQGGGGGFGGPDVSETARANYIGSTGNTDYRGILANTTNQEFLLTQRSAEDLYLLGKTFVTHMGWSPNGSASVGGDWASVQAVLQQYNFALDYTGYPSSF